LHFLTTPDIPPRPFTRFSPMFLPMDFRVLPRVLLSPVTLHWKIFLRVFLISFFRAVLEAWPLGLKLIKHPAALPQPEFFYCLSKGFFLHMASSFLGLAQVIGCLKMHFNKQNPLARFPSNVMTSLWQPLTLSPAPTSSPLCHYFPLCPLSPCGLPYASTRHLKVDKS